MTDYSKSKVYKLVSNLSADIYIGSCVVELSKRLSLHERSGNKCSSKKMFVVDAIITIVLLEAYPCTSKNELKARELYYITNNICININKPFVTELLVTDVGYNKAYNKEYRLANADKNKAYKKEYYLENADKAKAYKKEYRLANADKNKAQEKEYRLANADKIKAYDKEYRLKNADKIKAQHKEYRLANADKAKAKAYNKAYYLANKNLMI